MYVYLIETRAVHSSAIPALFYLALLLSTFWCCQSFWIQLRPGTCGLQACVRVHKPPRYQDCKSWAGGWEQRYAFIWFDYIYLRWECLIYLYLVRTCQLHQVGKCYKDGSELLSLCCDNCFGEWQGLGVYRFPAVPKARRKEASRLGSIETLKNTVK